MRGSTRHSAAVFAVLAATAASVATPALLSGGGVAGRVAHASVGGALERPLPLPLAAAASSRIGASSSGFWPRRDRAALRTQGGGLTTTFTAAGASLRAPAGKLTLAFASIARSAQSALAAPASPIAESSEVVYRRGTVSEHYQAGPYGLEQSFTVGTPPLRGAGRLMLSMRIGGNLRAHAQSSSVTFSGQTGAPALVYGALSARDATGRKLSSQLRLRGGVLELLIDDSRARYPVRIDPFLQQGPKLTGGAEESGAGEFGSGVALSADGNTALVGAPGDDANAGAAWVFSRSGTTWEQQGSKLTGGSEEGGNGRFGFRVALSSDGNTALVGGPLDGAGTGGAWVFSRTEGKWEQQGPKLTGGGEIGGGEFGIGVALSSDGNTALVGGSFDNNGAGAVWTFTRAEGEWTQQGAKLTGSGEVGAAHLGFNVALSEDGDTALAGGGADSSGVGAAWVFTRSEGEWAQQGAKLTGGGESGSGHFGFSVALSGDGDTAMIGGLADNSEAGAAWAFTRTEGAWTQQGAKLTGSGEVGNGLFGDSVSLSSSGEFALVGAPADSTNVGAAFAFKRTGSTWEQLGAKLTGSEESGKGRFGSGTSISPDASTALIGADSDSGEVGAAWVFSSAPLAPTVATGAASAITQASATLNATVNPNGETVTDCHFNYGTTTAYGESAPCSPEPGSGADTVPVSAAIQNLNANAVYHFQIVATNATGTSEGADQTFATTNPPEYGRCVKLAKRVQGQYSNAGCTKPATPEKFSFEWEGGPGAERHFTTTSALETTFETTGGNVVLCKGEAGSGEYTSAKSVGDVTMTFTGCEFSGAKCSSVGGSEGEITTETLEGVLGVEKTSTRGAKSNKIALDLFPVGGAGVVMEFSCGATAVSVRGSVLNRVPTNKMLATETMKYAEKAGKQKPEKFEGLPVDVLESSFDEGGLEQTGLATSLTQTNAEKIEVNTVV
jgi:FG-GAP repeat